MNTIFQQMLQKYDVKNNEEKYNAIKEIMQEFVLCGLSKAGFFNDAAFYGGTALRIFYGLDRFSEDLDFALLNENPNFDLSTYFPILQSTIESFGLSLSLEIKNKSKESFVQSAFFKADTIEYFLSFYPNDTIVGINKNEKIKIKFEIDTTPFKNATYETKYQLLPTPYSIKLYDESSLFAGKIHAIICRSWKSRVKGRDLYDYIFYLSQNSKFNLPYLKEKLVESNFITNHDSYTLEDAKKFLIKRFNDIDFKQAKEDVFPFIKDKNSLEIWSKEFFIDITNSLDCRK